MAVEVAYLVSAPEGVVLLAGFERLSSWWGHMRERASMVGSDPGMPGG